jgi:hypothetical protein
MTRNLWDVWRDGAVWMVQGPKARVHFFSGKIARAIAKRAKALDRVAKKTAREIAKRRRAAAREKRGSR